MHEINDRSRDIGPFVPGPDDDMIICRFLNTGGSP